MIEALAAIVSILFIWVGAYMLINGIFDWRDQRAAGRRERLEHGREFGAQFHAEAERRRRNVDYWASRYEEQKRNEGRVK